MTTHPKTLQSFANKSDQYLSEDCKEPPLTDSPQVRKLLGDESGKRVLCVGCGGGAECLSLSARGGIVAGVDTSQSLLDVAKAKCPHIDLRLAGVEALPYPSAAFDIVYCGHVLHYLRTWTAALQEMRRVITDEGKIVITIHHPADLNPTNEQLAELHASWYKDFEVVFYPRSLAEISRTFEQGGLKIVQMVEIKGEPGQPPIVAAYELRKNL